MNDQKEAFDILRKFPKYIETNDGCYYLTIVRKDWDGYNDINGGHSWIIMYAKHNSKSISLVKSQIKVVGATLADAIDQMKSEYDKFKGDNRGNPNVYRM